MTSIVGLGLDAVDVGRFRDVLTRTPGIADRVFTAGERAYAAEVSDPTERLAVRFAAKEAVMKAMGIGLGACGFAEIEVERADSGRPSVLLHGTARQLAADRGIGDWMLSLTHTDTTAQAIAMAIGEAV